MAATWRGHAAPALCLLRQRYSRRGAQARRCAPPPVPPLRLLRGGDIAAFLPLRCTSAAVYICAVARQHNAVRLQGDGCCAAAAVLLLRRTAPRQRQASRGAPARGDCCAAATWPPLVLRRSLAAVFEPRCAGTKLCAPTAMVVPFRAYVARACACLRVLRVLRVLRMLRMLRVRVLRVLRFACAKCAKCARHVLRSSDHRAAAHQLKVERQLRWLLLGGGCVASALAALRQRYSRRCAPTRSCARQRQRWCVLAAAVPPPRRAAPRQR